RRELQLAHFLRQELALELLDEALRGLEAVALRPLLEQLLPELRRVVALLLGPEHLLGGSAPAEDGDVAVGDALAHLVLGDAEAERLGGLRQELPHHELVEHALPYLRPSRRVPGRAAPARHREDPVPPRRLGDLAAVDLRHVRRPGAASAAG